MLQQIERDAAALVDAEDKGFAPGVSRTRDLQIRNLLLYPTELQAQKFS